MRTRCGRDSAVTLVKALATSAGADARLVWERLLRRTKEEPETAYPAAETLLVLLWELRSARREAAASALELLVARLGACEQQSILKVLFLLRHRMALDPGLGCVSLHALYETGQISSTKSASSFLRDDPLRQTERELKPHLRESRAGCFAEFEESPMLVPAQRKEQILEVQATGFFDSKQDLAAPRGDAPEPDSEPPCTLPHAKQPAPAAQPVEPTHDRPARKPRKNNRLWESSISALESRMSWNDDEAFTASVNLADSRTLRFAWLALHGISSPCFQVLNLAVHCIVGGAQLALLREWGDCCSSCLRLRKLATSLSHSKSLTARALGDVCRDLLNVLDGKVSGALRKRQGFMRFWVELQPWLRQLQGILALCGCLRQDQEELALPRQKELWLLDGLVGFCRAQELSAVPWQACSRPLEQPVNLMPLWVLQRAMQPLLRSLTARAQGEASQKGDVLGLDARRVPGFLHSVGTQLASLPQRLQILQSDSKASSGAGAAARIDAAAPEASERYFSSPGREAEAFAPQGRPDLAALAEEAPAEPQPTWGSGLRVLVSMHGSAAPESRRGSGREAQHWQLTGEVHRKPAAPRQLQARSREAPLTPKNDTAKLKQREYKTALDAQLAEKKSLEASHMESMDSVTLAVLQPPSPRMLQEARDALDAEHRQRMQQAQKEQRLLRWKLQHLRGAPALQELDELTDPDSTRTEPAPQMVQASPGDRHPHLEQPARAEKRLAQEVLRIAYMRAAFRPALWAPSEPVQPERPAVAAATVHEPLAEPHTEEAVVLDVDLERTLLKQPALPDRPPLYTGDAASMSMIEDAERIRAEGAVPLDVSLENCLMRPLRIQSEWVELAVVRKLVFGLDLLRHLKLLQRCLLMGESRLLDSFLAKAIQLYAARPTFEEAAVVEGALNALFQSAVPRPAAAEDDALLSRISVQLSPTTSLLGHGPVSFLDSLRFRMKLDFPMSEIFTDRVLLQYTRLFRIIALAHHALECLKGAWSAMAGLRGKGSAAPPTALIALRHELHHFAATIHRYLVVDVVATEFKQLEAKVHEAASLDELLEAQSGCLRRCLARSFLEAGSQDALTAVVGILDQALELSRLLEEVDLRRPLPAWALGRLRRIEAILGDLRSSLKLCYVEGGLAEAEALVQEVLPNADDLG